MTKAQRVAHAREQAQAKAAEADRAAARPAAPEIPRADPAQATVTALHWPERARQTRESLDRDRRRRREAAVPDRPKPPPPLGASLRQGNLFLLPDEDQDGRPDDGPVDSE